METIQFLSGLDLCQVNEFTALAVPEKQSTDDDFDRPQAIYPVRHLEGLSIGTSYSAIFDRVLTLFVSKFLPGNTLVVDQIAAGAPVIQSLRRTSLLCGLPKGP